MLTNNGQAPKLDPGFWKGPPQALFQQYKDLGYTITPNGAIMAPAHDPDDSTRMDNIQLMLDNGHAGGFDQNGNLIDFGVNYDPGTSGIAGFMNKYGPLVAAAGLGLVAAPALMAGAGADAWMGGVQAGGDAINAGGLTTVAGDATGIGTVAGAGTTTAGATGMSGLIPGTSITWAQAMQIPGGIAAAMALVNPSTDPVSKAQALATLGNVGNNLTNNNTGGNASGNPGNSSNTSTNAGTVNADLSGIGITTNSDGSYSYQGKPVQVDDSGPVTYKDTQQPVIGGNGQPLDTSSITNTGTRQTNADGSYTITDPRGNVTNFNPSGQQINTGGNSGTKTDGGSGNINSLLTGAAQIAPYLTLDPGNSKPGDYMTNAGWKPLDQTQLAQDASNWAGFKQGGIGEMPHDLYDTYANLLKNPDDLAKNPAYAAYNQQGQQAAERALQARGMNYSGNIVQQLQQDSAGRWAQYFPSIAQTYNQGAGMEAGRWQTQNQQNMAAGNLAVSGYNAYNNANAQAGATGLNQFGADVALKDRYAAIMGKTGGSIAASPYTTMPNFQINNRS